MTRKITRKMDTSVAYRTKCNYFCFNFSKEHIVFFYSVLYWTLLLLFRDFPWRVRYHVVQACGTQHPLYTPPLSFVGIKITSTPRLTELVLLNEK